MDKQVKLSIAWQAMLQLPQKQWDLCHAGLLIAEQLQADLDVSHYERQLDAMAARIHDRVAEAMDVHDRIREINAYFYTELGFAGDKRDYYLPDNSLLNLVMERRRGIPVTLAAIYLRLAAAAGLDAYGIGFPGHYLVGVSAGQEKVILDPFDQGRSLERAQLQNMLQQLSQVHVDELELQKNLQAASNLETIVRMLRNLKQIYMEGQKVEQALACIEMILSILPESPDELRDRGMIYQHIEYSQGAINDLKHYLELVPHAEERGVIEALLDSLQSQRKSLH